MTRATTGTPRRAGALTTRVRAVYLESFGGPDVLRVGERPTPLVGPDTVLVRVQAAGVNPVDWKIREGHLQGAFPHVLPVVPGWDVAGDDVIGYVRKDVVSEDTYAELVSASERHLALRPPSVDVVQAGALPLAGLTALQSLDAVRVGAGDTVLVHAAAGGVGAFAVQLAAARGARVIGTASERNHDFLRSLGAEPVLYGERLVDAVQALAPDGVDAAVDYVGGEAIAQSAKLVRDPARSASNVDPAVAESGGTYCFVRPDALQLAQLVAMVDEGSLRVHVQQAFPLEQVADAHRLLEQGHVRGKLVLTV